MKVLHLDEQRGWRGGEQQANWLIEGLAARGIWVGIVGRPNGAFLEHDHGGAPQVRLALPLRGEFDLYSAWRLASLARKHQADLVHAHTSHAHTIALLARCFAPRLRVVVSRRVSFAPRGHALNRWKYAAPDRILCVSAKVAEVLEAFGVPRPQLAVVHSSVDPARLDVPPLPRSAMGVPEEAPLLVNAGAMVGHKDHANLLDAFALVRKELPGAWLAVAGDGPLRPEIEARAVRLGIAGCVVFLGQRKDAPALIRAGDVYVSSSWSEGLGTSVLEALACGTPVVAAEAGGAAEMVLPGKTGWLTPVRDPEALAKAITNCLADKEGAAAMAREGKNLVEAEFTAPRMVERTVHVYENVLAETKGAAN